MMMPVTQPHRSCTSLAIIPVLGVIVPMAENSTTMGRVSERRRLAILCESHGVRNGVLEADGAGDSPCP